MPELIACPSCQNKISERAPTCPKCGSELLKQCKVCKKFIPIDSISCPECGDPNPFDEQLISDKTAEKYVTKITAISIPKQDNEDGDEKYIKTTKAVRNKLDSGGKQWSIYTKGSKIIAIKHGFCWPAFFLTFGWAIFKRLWVVAICYFVFVNFLEFSIYNTLNLMDFELGAVQLGAVQLETLYIGLILLEFIFRFAFGYSGNKLVISWVEKRGLWKVITVNAKNKKSALEQYMR